MSAPIEPVSHDWARARFKRWAAGMLDDEQREAMEAHLATCEACRAATRSLVPTPSSSPNVEHLPSELIASWNRRAPRLSGELRRLTLSHLKHCADCRRELETLGHDPDLIRQPGPDSMGKVLPITKPAASPGTQSGFGRVEIPRPPWRVSLAMAAALMAVALVGVASYVALRASRAGRDSIIARSGDRAAPQAPEQKGVSDVGRAPGPNPQEATLLALGPAPPGVASLTEVLRGNAAGGPAPYVSFDPERHEIAFEPPRALTLAEGERVELTVVDAAGETRRSLTTTLDALFPAGGPRAIILRQGEPRLEPGRYALRIRVSDRDGVVAEESSYAFEIR